MTISALTGIGCGHNDQTISTVISKLPPTSGDGISADIALNIAASSYICVLSPYASRVSAGKGFSDDSTLFFQAKTTLEMKGTGLSFMVPLANGRLNGCGDKKLN